MPAEHRTVEAWPFLIAAGRSNGSAVRAAPPFLIRSEALNRLLGSEPEDAVSTDKAVPLEIPGHPPTWVVAALCDARDGSGKLVRDQGGRLISAVYGLIVPSGEVASSAIDKVVSAELDGLYHRFLADEAAGPFPTSAHFIDVQLSTGSGGDTFRCGSGEGSSDLEQPVHHISDGATDPKPNRLLLPILVGLSLIVGLLLGYMLGNRVTVDPLVGLEVSTCQLTSLGEVLVSADVADELGSLALERRVVITFLDAAGGELASIESSLTSDRPFAELNSTTHPPDGATSIACELVRERG